MGLREKQGFFSKMEQFQKILENPVCGVVTEIGDKLSVSYASKVKSEVDLNDAKRKYFEALTESLIRDKGKREKDITRIFDEKSGKYEVLEAI